MFDKAPFDYAAYDRWSQEVGELTINFPLSVSYVCVGGKYSGRIVCQKGDALDKANVVISDCRGYALPLTQFTASVKVYDYSSEEEILTLSADIISIPGTLSIPLLVNELDIGYYKMKVVLDYNGEPIIAPSYGFIKLSVV